MQHLSVQLCRPRGPDATLTPCPSALAPRPQAAWWKTVILGLLPLDTHDTTPRPGKAGHSGLQGGGGPNALSILPTPPWPFAGPSHSQLSPHCHLCTSCPEPNFSPLSPDHPSLNRGNKDGTLTPQFLCQSTVAAGSGCLHLLFPCCPGLLASIS